MSGYSILSAFNKLSLACPLRQNIRSITTYKPNLFYATPALCAEPMKKKKKMDPGIIKMREERKKKKIEKQIKRLEKHAKQLKPLEELEVATVYLENKKARTRPAQVLSPEEIESHITLQKEWANYQSKKYMADVKMIDRIQSSQFRAMAVLKEVSEELHEAALQIDIDLMPYEGKGPVNTPPIKNYDSPDGEYVNVSRKWEN